MDNLHIKKISNGYVTNTHWLITGEENTTFHKTLDDVCSFLLGTHGTLEKDLITMQSYRITELQKRIERLEKASLEETTKQIRDENIQAVKET
jgi:hypothetical protein